MNDQQLLDRLESLAERADTSTTVVDDVARGRRLLRRQRVRTGLGGVVAVGTVAGALIIGSSLLHSGRTDSATGPAVASHAPSTASSLVPAGDGSAGATATGSAPSPGPASGSEPAPGPATRDALVTALRHLDPRGEHLDARDLTGEAVGWGSDTSGLTSVSLDVRWHEPGQPSVGVARVQIWRTPFSCTLTPPTPGVRMRCQTVRLGSVTATKMQFLYDDRAPSEPQYYARNAAGTWVSGYVSPSHGPDPRRLENLSVTPAQLGAMLSDPGLVFPAAR